MKQILSVTDLRLFRSSSFCLRVKRLTLRSGTILCIAGPNGSGKTSLIECLVGLNRIASSAISIQGQTIDQALYHTKRAIGFVPDDDAWLIRELSAMEYFALLQGIYKDVGVSLPIMQRRIQSLAKQLHFTAFHQSLATLSHGNKKKVQIIAGLMHEPMLIVLDDLRNGLDPLAIMAAEHIVKQEAARGACIVAATHDLWWAERIADETMILVDGGVAIHQKTRALITRYGSLEKLFIHLVAQTGAEYATV